MLDYSPKIIHFYNIQKAISRYKQLYNISSKKANQKIFKNHDIPPLDPILDRSNNILTNPDNMAHEIHLQQTIINKSQVPTCYYQLDHDSDCTCSVYQYPWHNIIGYTIDKYGAPHTPLHTYFDNDTYNLCLKNLKMDKAPSPDKISNSILKSLPPKFHTVLYLFFLHYYKITQIPSSWKTSLTILFYKKGNPTHLSNYRPIALANTIYKLFISTLTTILIAYGKNIKSFMIIMKAFAQNVVLLDNYKFSLVLLKC
jgi:hypothetical protein